MQATGNAELIAAMLEYGHSSVSGKDKAKAQARKETREENVTSFIFDTEKLEALRGKTIMQGLNNPEESRMRAGNISGLQYALDQGWAADKKALLKTAKRIGIEDVAAFAGNPGLSAGFMCQNPLFGSE